MRALAGPDVLQEVPGLIESYRNTSDTVVDSGGGFLRIFAGRFEDELLLWGDLVEHPADGDEVVEVAGALVFLDATAAAALAGRGLRAPCSEGRVQQSLRGQP